MILLIHQHGLNYILQSCFRTVKFPKGKIYEDIATTYRLFQKCDYVACGFESKYNYMVRMIL